MTQRKPSVRIISFLLAIAMLFTLLPNGLKAYAADIHDFISYEITYFGLTPDDDGVVKNGTSFEVRLEGSISADYTDTVLPLEFTIDLETSEVKLSGSGTINYNGTRAGSFTVDADGTVHITIDDNAGGNSFINQGNRNFSLEFSAAVDAEETEDGSEKDTTVKVGEQEIDVTVQFPDSYLNGEKTAVGEAWYDPDTDMVYQTYIIRQTAVNGNVSEAYIYDYMGEWLSGPVDDVKITYDIYGKYDGPKESYEYAEQESDSEFYVYIPEIRKGETIEIEYTLAIDKKYFSFEDYDNRSLNQFGSDYVDQNGNDHDPTPDGWVYPNVERPGVTKGGEYTVNGDEVVWTIIVDAGIFETCDDFIADFGITVTDIPGDGLADEGEKIILPSYTNNGDGTYTFTYTTELTDEVISQLKDLSKTVTVHNDVLAGNDDFTFSGEADVTRDGIGILDKEATATGPDADGRFAWKSTLTIPVEGIEGLVFTDSTAGSKNGHKIIKDTMVIDGTPIAELEKAGKVTVTVSGRQLVVAFSDDYLAELQANNRRAHTIDGYQGNVYLADIVITYMTEPDNDADLDGSYTFTNTSDLEYTITDSGDKVTATDSDEYIQIIEAKKYFSKQGLEWSSLNSDWLIDLEVRLDELEVGDVFKIIDTPENMEIIEDTIIPYVHLNGWTTTEISEIYDDIDSFLTFRDNKNGTYTFTFTITQGLYDAVYGALESWVPASDVYFSIGYCTRITNPDEWDWDTEYTNTADGTFNGNPGEQTIATRHFSKNDNVSKRFIYSIDNDKFDFGVSNGKLNARFEVKINPNSLMLGNEDVIYLTDKMSEGLVMIPASTVITDAVTGKVLKNGDDYFIDFDEDKNEIYFTVPNGRSLLLTYMAEIAGDAPVIGEPDVGFAAGNTIELYVKDGASFASNTDASGNIFKSSGTLISEGYSITVSKVSEINGTKLFPEGANFEVVRVYYNELTEEFELATDNMQGENIVVTPIEGTNLTTITGLVPDAVYRLKETEVPDGFKLSDQVIYFMFPVDPGTVVPPGVVVFDNLEVLYFNNDPDFGGLKIFKTVDNENITDAELRNALTFTVQKEDGKYVDEEGKLHDEPVEIPFRSFKKQSDGSFVLTFTQLPAGTYTVTETNTEIDGYKLITDASVTEGTVEVVTGDISEISLRDSYEEVGNLTITKSIDGLNVTDEEKAGGLKFTVRNKDGKYLDIDGTLHDEIVEITLDKFTQRDGIYVLEFTDIPVGEYTVTETNTEIEGYKFISEESATSDSAEVKHKQTAEIGLSDSYEEVGNLKITKSIDGLNVTDEEKAGGLKFTVRNKDGKYLDVDGSLHDEIVEITLDKFTQKADGTYELIFTDIAVGEYTVTETNTEIDGYRFLREESVTSDSAEVKQKETAEIALSDSYEAIGNLKITKSIDGLNVTDEEKAGGLKFTVKNKDGKYLDIDGTLHDEIVEITLDKFTQKDDGTYELIFTDIAAGEYTVTETNTEIDGYRLVTDASVTGDTAEVTKGETTVINLKDSYEAIGNLKITKSIDGLNVTDEEKAGGLKFTVKNKDGKYLDIDGTLHDEIVEITLDKFTQKPDGTYELIFTDIPVGEYTVTETNTEIDGYRFIREESTTSDSAEVKQKETAEIALKDSYEAIGNLKITKSIDGLNVTDEEKAGGLKFTVRNKDGKYLDVDGTLHDEIIEITLDKFTQKADGTYELIFTDIVVGEYIVTETYTEIDGYRFLREESATFDSAEVKQKETVEIALKDSYEAIGNLKITKSIDGLNVTDEEKAGGLKFTVRNKDGKYLDVDGTLHDEIIEITLDKFTQKADGTYELIFTDIVVGEYIVTETYTEIDGYRFLREESATSDSAEVKQKETAEIALKDSYEAIGNLKITKSIDGLNVTDEEKAGGLKFTVRNKDGKYLDIDGTLHDEIIEITLDKFTQKPDGTYELVFTDIAAGEYIVTETNTEIDGYRLVTDASVTGDTAEVTKGETTVINLKDSYEAIGNLKITKSIDGLNVTDEEKAGGLKFTVRNKDGKYLDIDGTLHDEIVEITLDKFTQKDDGTYELVFTDIVVGEYTVTETNTEIDGYKFVSEESTTNGSAEVKSNETVEIALKDSYEKIVSVTINKKDIANDEEIEGAKLEMFDKDNNKIDEWISEKGKTHTIEGLKPGEEYILRETVTPDGYETATEITFTVDENGEVTVVSGKDGSVEDGVLIVNDTKISESEPETPDNNTNVNDSDKDNGEDEPNNDNTDSSDNVDNNPETGYKTDAMSVFLLTASALVVVSAKKRKKANNK